MPLQLLAVGGDWAKYASPLARGPRSLVDMCCRVAIENIHLITSLGSLPPEHANKILKAVKSAHQLRQLELNSDYDIYDVTSEHWQRIIKRDFPFLTAEHNFVPEDRESWHKVWERYKALQDEADSEATEKLKQSFAATQEQRDSRRATIVSVKESLNLKPPRSRSSASQPQGKGNFLQKAKKDLAVESTRFKLPEATSTASQIQKAPVGMLNEVRIQQQPARVRAPRKKVVTPKTKAEPKPRPEAKPEAKSEKAAPANAAGKQLEESGRKQGWDKIYADFEIEWALLEEEQRQSKKAESSAAAGPPTLALPSPPPAPAIPSAPLATALHNGGGNGDADKPLATPKSTKAPLASPQAPKKPPAKRKGGGLLSAAPGANARAAQRAKTSTRKATAAEPKSSGTTTAAARGTQQPTPAPSTAGSPPAAAAQLAIPTGAAIPPANNASSPSPPLPGSSSRAPRTLAPGPKAVLLNESSVGDALLRIRGAKRRREEPRVLVPNKRPR